MGDGVADAIGGLLAGFTPGQLIAGYQLEEQIGAGGMAVVFRARDDRLGRRVALKILAPGLAADQSFRRRFIRESRAATVVDDPHIIPVYEAGEAAGALFIAMRLVHGRDARTLLADEGPLPAARVAAIISPIASALAAAHAAGLVHRDVKPANILVDEHPDRPDHVYLSDFGVSKGSLATFGLTGVGEYLGTPSYCAPEQIQGHAVDGRADQYGLACAAFELLTGHPPFERDQGLAVIWAHLSQDPPSLRSLRPDLPELVDPVIARALAKNPADRYPRCTDFAEAFRHALGLAPYHPTATGTPTAPANPAAPAVPAPRYAPAGLDGQTTVSTAFAAGTRIPGQLSQEVTAVAFSPNEITLVIGDMTGRVRLCDAATGRLTCELTDYKGKTNPAGAGVESVACSSDSSLLAAGYSDGGTRLWDLSTAGALGRLEIPGSAGVAALAFGADRSVLAAGYDNGSTCLWDVGAERPAHVLVNPGSGGVLAIAFSPDGRVLAAGDGNGACYIWDAIQGRPLGTLTRFSSGEVFAVAFTADGSVLATGHGNGDINLWDAQGGDHIATLANRKTLGVSVYSLAFSPAELTDLAAAYAVGGTRIWDTGRGRTTATLGAQDPGEVLCLAFSPDGRNLATGSSDGAAWLWNLATRRRLAAPA